MYIGCIETIARLALIQVEVENDTAREIQLSSVREKGG